MAVVTMKNLLESGVHFGHQTRRWDPRMKRFIFTQRNGIHIIDLQKTIAAIREAYDLVRNVVLSGQSVLFVGTKKQAQSAIKREAEHCEMFYVNNRWLGGMLTNYATIKKSLLRLKKIEKMEIDGTFNQLTKMEISILLKEKGRLEKNLGGIKNMNELPGILFVIDPMAEAIAVAEARRMKIPVIAVVDTNCNPDGIDCPIPGNDDAIRAINLFTQVIANAVIEADNEQGLKVIETLQNDNEEEEISETKTVESSEPTVAPKSESDSEGSVEKPETASTPSLNSPPPPLESSKEKEEKPTTPVSENTDVTPQDVKKLRLKTDAGMLDCKKALIKAGGNFEEAEKILKEQGLAGADSRSGRATNNGLVFIKVEKSLAAMSELTCETDFVAKTDIFQAAGKKIVESIISSKSAENTEEYNTIVKEAMAILKENMQMGRSVFWNVQENEQVVHYAHNDGQIGVLVKISCDSAETAAKDEVKSLAFDLALHAAAFNPLYLDREQVDSTYLKEQEEIFTVQAQNLGDKPEKIIQGIVQGKLKKHLAKICFVDQGFVKDEKSPVSQVLEETAKTVGGTLKLTDFAYIAVGQN